MGYLDVGGLLLVIWYSILIELGIWYLVEWGRAFINEVEFNTSPMYKKVSEIILFPCLGDSAGSFQSQHFFLGILFILVWPILLTIAIISIILCYLRELKRKEKIDIWRK